MKILFRWSIWGDKRKLLELLVCSVDTFRRAFGGHARYVVCTDEPAEISALMHACVEIMPYANEEVGFYVETKSMWRKWCPWPRLDRTCHEFYVDADVFIVSTPTELWRFCLEPSGRNFVVLREAPGSPAYFGNFGSRVAPILPPINAGLFGQRAGVDLTPDLLVELEWWKAHYSAGGAHVQDDQGAIAAALSHHYLQEQVEFLPQERYRIISPTSNRALTSLDGVAAFHATHPHHPAFHRFRSEVTQYIAGGELQ